MSKIAKIPIKLPSNVQVDIVSSQIKISWPKGVLTHNLCNHVKIITTGLDAIFYLNFEPATEHPLAWAHAGTARAIINNMIKGVTEGFALTLELVGVGYRAQVNDRILNLSLGYSHPIEYTLVDGIVAQTPNNTT